MVIGILALQGAFIEHAMMLKRLGVTVTYINDLEGLQQPLDGLIIPGGESTTMRKLLDELNMVDALINRINKGLPVFGTCAGMILLARDVDHERSHLKTLAITVKRNAFGRQLGSFKSHLVFNNQIIEAIFIRAPYVLEASEGVEVLALHEGKIVAAVSGKQLVTAFHPELTQDTTVHQYFLNLISQN